MLSTVLEDPEGEAAAEIESSFVSGEGYEASYDYDEDEGEEEYEDEGGGEEGGGDVEDNVSHYGEFNDRGGIRLGGNFNWWAKRQD
ncbi:hypothetical protein TWF718_007390 [Orbilia javanica]|uniref:Uncharacterized protein n=1 Tax=Orbilia javanica TaxID=47235 RepID=A0AAN8RIZ5_9PEZI